MDKTWQVLSLVLAKTWRILSQIFVKPWPRLWQEVCESAAAICDLCIHKLKISHLCFVCLGIVFCFFDRQKEAAITGLYGRYQNFLHSLSSDFSYSKGSNFLHLFFHLGGFWRQVNLNGDFFCRESTENQYWKLCSRWLKTCWLLVKTWLKTLQV